MKFPSNFLCMIKQACIYNKGFFFALLLLFFLLDKLWRRVLCFNSFIDFPVKHSGKNKGKNIFGGSYFINFIKFNIRRDIFCFIERKSYSFKSIYFIKQNYKAGFTCILFVMLSIADKASMFFHKGPFCLWGLYDFDFNISRIK